MVKNDFTLGEFKKLIQKTNFPDDAIFIIDNTTSFLNYGVRRVEGFTATDEKTKEVKYYIKIIPDSFTMRIILFFKRVFIKDIYDGKY